MSLWTTVRAGGGAYNVKSYGATGDGSTDDTVAIQAAIDGVARGRGRNVFIPAGAYKITSTIIVPNHVSLMGVGSQPFETNQNGSVFWWYGPSGSPAVQTAVTADEDWSRGEIHNLRIENKTVNAAGVGLHVRNPQNCSTLENVTVKGFPTRAFLVEETKTTGTIGATPGVFSMKRCFGIGGAAVLEIRSGQQPVTIDDCSFDTTATTTIAGVLVTPGPTFSLSRIWPLSFRGSKVEIAATTTTAIPAWQVTADAPITWDGCEAHNVAGLVTKGAIEHTNTGRKWARFDIRNMACWQMGYALRLLSAGLDIPAPNTATPWAYSFAWNEQTNFAITYHTAALPASTTSLFIRVGGQSGSYSRGITLPAKAVLTAMSAELSAALTAGTVNVGIYKNNATQMANLTLNTTRQKHWLDLMSPDIASVDQVLAAGDNVGCAVNASSADMAPSGSLGLSVTAFIRLFNAAG